MGCASSSVSLVGMEVSQFSKQVLTGAGWASLNGRYGNANCQIQRGPLGTSQRARLGHMVAS